MKKQFLVLLLCLCCICPQCSLADPSPSFSWYEVFVRSYQDSNGDGIGDLPGLTSRLDYIKDLGFDGIWLMPIMPSPSYHKYDVTDYKNVDPEYGTVDDLKQLVQACHSRGIRLILDLPLNHTSTRHPWFQEAVQALRSGSTENTRIAYYHFSHTPGSVQTPVEGSDWFYEEQFQGGGMPDLNLDNPEVMEEIRSIIHFWLIDCDVDGFRLDSVTNFDTGNTEHNIELLNGIRDICTECRPGSFLVAEAWTGLSQLAEYYKSTIDSFFLFPASQAEGWIARSLRSRQPAKTYCGYLQDLQNAIPDGLLATFLSNHDTGRAVGSLQGRSRPETVKFAHTALAMLGGCTFTYYGEEIGMVGSGDDPNKRLAMYWNDSDMTLQPPGTTKIEYAYPCADEQLKDPDSLLHYIRRLNEIRKQYPVLSSRVSEICYSDPYSCVLRKKNMDSEVFVCMNLSASREVSIPVGESAEALAGLQATEAAFSLSSGVLTLPPYSLVVLSSYEPSRP